MPFGMVDPQTRHRILTVIQLVRAQYIARTIDSYLAFPQYHLLVKLPPTQPALGVQATLAHDIARQTAQPLGLDALRYGPVMVAGGVQGLYIIFEKIDGAQAPMPLYAAAPSVRKQGFQRPGLDDRCTVGCTW